MFFVMWTVTCMKYWNNLCKKKNEMS